MRLAIMQAYFFPYLGYFQAIYAVDRYLLYENLSYIKDGWMHRNRIQGRNPEPFQFTVPVQGKSSNRRIAEITLVDSPVWRRKLKNALQLNYRGAPFFDETMAVVEPLIDGRADTLHAYNAGIIRGLCTHLGIETTIVSENRAYDALEEELAQEEADGRFETGPAKKVERVLRICQAEGATMFVNAIGGTDLYGKEVFAEHGIDLRFVQTRPNPYTQFTDPFVPSLSILDVLMFNGREGTRPLLEGYDLV